MRNCNNWLIVWAIAFVISLSCNRVTTNLAGPQGPVEALTQYADPIEENPKDATATNTMEAATSQAVYTQEAIPQQIEPSITGTDTQNMLGVWHGTAQWLCDNYPVWSTSLEFKSNGIVSAALSTATDYAGADGSWAVNGNEISIQFEFGFWSGTISGNTISGIFTEEHCNGVWSVSKD